MTKLSRRAIAAYAADQLLAGEPAGNVAKDLFALLVESGRQNEADFLMEDIAWELEARQALVSARVTSAWPLSPVVAAEIKKLLKAATGSKQVFLESNVDKSIVGGARIDTAAKVWDYTIARKLSALREAF